ncbi:LEAF RUST 10 DISEASE-RESISTANCE LOCUS RECEPTOR-LIKE PROTEIN KINASE-like 1.5 [Prosopis cineraria]|uniref:LEAF RUST 10 DISEASE-RESISTANCE LOCUS RECEPTOR-LIKE PROTEIN KINASE-like 1.5 n=1 Tax=Prosopis cineraria TaxID=364024 RepID=UPI00240F5CB1|nr:LEAF RUST 10 DISEASE-RESISTANCE LOCUS RECEPTOR-LIKE PROTEIN KINASE-like 1.5 [Prosopis cineraria]
MPPPSLSPFFALCLLLSFLSHLASPHPCSSHPHTSSPCPPFRSIPPFPFSFSLGCGHPSFQINCSTPHSLISINNFTFSVLRYNPNSSSLTLLPNLQPTSSAAPAYTNCSTPHYLSLLNRSLDLSGSPFRISDAFCSRISNLQACSPPPLPNCSHCPWECSLIKNPAHVLRDCGSVHHSVSDLENRCQSDVLGYLDDILARGIDVEWDEAQDPYFSSCRNCSATKGVCGFNSSDPHDHFMCIRPESESSFTPAWIQRVNPKRNAVLSLVIPLMLLFLFVSIAVAIFRSRRFKSSRTEEDPTILFLHNQRSASLLPPVFTYEELEAATNRFDPKRKIGDGGFGSVFLGQLYDGRIVAVKYLHKHHAEAAAGRAFSTKSFCNEILILSSIDHPNLVKLHGYCSDPRGLLLVYDYVTNGTLADHLHGPKISFRKGSLTWQVRIDIALQTALAMEYLHCSVVPPIVHRDITSSNIFVEKDMRIKVGDFGLSRLLVVQDTSSSSTGFVWTGPQGTPGYLDPDYHRSFRLTEKSDVYSFGVVLLELISGLKPVDQSRDKREIALADLVVSRIHMGQLDQVVDPFLAKDEEAMDTVTAVAELAFRCVAADKDDRPDSKEVVEELKRVRIRSRAGLRSTSNSHAGAEVAKNYEVKGSGL